MIRALFCRNEFFAANLLLLGTGFGCKSHLGQTFNFFEVVLRRQVLRDLWTHGIQMGLDISISVKLGNFFLDEWISTSPDAFRRDARKSKIFLVGSGMWISMEIRKFSFFRILTFRTSRVPLISRLRTRRILMVDTSDLWKRRISTSKRDFWLKLGTRQFFLIR
ncbi:unnamed protein product [Rhizophagus irregularis]|nr:unnamed protein product [Rhizophagus irregularis]